MKEAWDAQGRLYYVDDNGNRVQSTQAYNPFEKLQRKAQANLENIKSFINNSDTNSQSYKDKINLALGLITAPMGGSSLLAAKGASALTPLVGNNIGKAISSSAIGGATGSGVAGFGRGLVEGENPLLTMVSDGALGLLFGGALGAAGGKIGKVLAEKALAKGNKLPQQYFDEYVAGLNNPNRKDLQNYRSFNLGGKFSNGNAQVLYDTPDDFVENMKNFDISNYSKDEYKQLRKQAKTFYKNNLSPKTASVGDVNVLFTDLGLDEQLSKGLHNVDVFTDLINQIETGNLHPELVNNRPNDKRLFHIVNNKFKDKDMEYQLLNDKNVDKFYFAKDITNKKELPQIGRNQNTTYEEVPTNSITNNLDNLNPSAGLYEKIVDNSVNLQKPIPKGYMRLYRGLQEEFNPNYDKSKLDNVNGYESWTDNYDLAKAYGDNVYYIDIPENTIAKDIIDENPKSLTYGDRHLIYEHDKPVGIKGKNGKEYMLYTYHENYPNIKYNKI